MNADSPADPSAEPAGGGAPQGAPAGGDGPGADRGGVTIPGYQPVEVLGNAPSFGKWVRAIQVRMDRHVLLKMLKPGVPVAHEYFSREISTVVRLDGEGVLRAIDEGTVKGVRYLVVDEAEGIPLSASSVGGEEGWASLTRTALELWRRVLERECILLPIPAVSWRRLPAGDFASADLGWLVPIGQKIPTHPWLDAEITARESRPQDAIASFDATGKALAEALGIPLPAAWRRASQSLASVAADAQFEDVLRAFIDAKAAVDPPKTQRTVVGVLAGLVLVIALVWGTVHVMTKDPAVDPVVDGGGDEIVEPETPPDPQDPPTEDPLLAEKRRAEELAWAALDPLIPDRGEEDDLLPVVPLTVEQKAAFISVIEDHPETEAAESAAVELQLTEIIEVDRATGRFSETAEAVRARLADGQLAEAEGLIVAFRGEAAEQGFLERLPDLSAPLEQLERALTQAGAASVDALSSLIGEARRKREFRRGAVEVSRSLAGLLASDQLWAEEKRLELLETATRYERVKRAIETGISRAADHAVAADFDAAVIEVAFVDGETEFPELAARRSEWAGHLDRARVTARAISAELASPERERKRHAYFMSNGEKIQGRIQEVAPAQFKVKLDGMRKVRTILWLDLSPEQWAELAGGELSAERRLLVETLLGSESAIERAEALSPAPAWIADARRRLERAANADLTRLLAAGREAMAAGKGSEARNSALEIVASIPPELWGEERAELSEWSRAYWGEIGPASAFPGATVQWQSDRSIEIEFDFENPEALRAWAPSRPGRGGVTHLRESLAATGFVWLAPGGHSDLFEETLQVRTRLATLEPQAPNLNVVLFAHERGNQRWGGDLFGLGFKPPPPYAARIEGAVPVFFPANVCGPLQAAEDGRGSELFWKEPRPKVTRSTRVELEVTSGPSELEIDWKGVHDETYDASPDRRRLGTVQFRSYHAQILVGKTRIEGRISERWWERWVGERVEDDLGQ